MFNKEGTTLVEVLLALSILSVMTMIVSVTVHFPELNSYYFIQDALDLQSEAVAYEKTTQLNPMDYQGRGRPIYYNENGNINAAQTVCFKRGCVIFELGSGRLVR